MYYEIKKIDLFVVWFAPARREEIIAYLLNVYENTTECEFEEANILQTLEFYFEENPITNKEVIDYISYYDLEINKLMSGDFSFEKLQKSIIKHTYKELTFEVKIVCY